MTTALVVLASLVALGLLVTGVGYFLPVEHTATREQTYSASVDKLFAAVSTPSEYPRWRRGVKGVEMLPARQGKPTFREIGSNGPMTYVFDEVIPDQRVVSRIADTGLAFGGSWTYEFSPSAGGSRLRITENGEVYNPFFRFMARYVFGHEYTMKRYLADLEHHIAAR